MSRRLPDGCPWKAWRRGQGFLGTGDQGLPRPVIGQAAAEAVPSAPQPLPELLSCGTLLLADEAERAVAAALRSLGGVPTGAQENSGRNRGRRVERGAGRPGGHKSGRQEKRGGGPGPGWHNVGPVTLDEPRCLLASNGVFCLLLAFCDALAHTPGIKAGSLHVGGCTAGCHASPKRKGCAMRSVLTLASSWRSGASETFGGRFNMLFPPRQIPMSQTIPIWVVLVAFMALTRTMASLVPVATNVYPLGEIRPVRFHRADGGW